MSMELATSQQSIKTLSSTSNSDESNSGTDRHPSVETRVCLVGTAAKHEKLKGMLEDLKIPHLSSETGQEYENDDPQFETIFILEEFEGEHFKRLKNSDNRILGPPVISVVAATKEPLPYTSRPLFCTCMQGLNLCFTNFKTKEHLAHLVTLCHYMGACIRKDMSAKIDFLVTNSISGSKYRTAVSLGTPVMKEEWIHRCWSARSRGTPYQATDDEFLVPCKSKPFEGCSLSFLGFSEQEKQHMQDQARQQGGSTLEVGDQSCTHLVVEENSVKTLPFEPSGKLYVLVQEWFWGSIQIEAKATESLYTFHSATDSTKSLTRSSTTSSLLGTPRWRGSTSTLTTKTRASSGKHSFSRKRSRLREETLAKLAQDTDNDTTRQIPPRKRPSTDTSACVPDSMLDISNNTTTTSVMSPHTPENIFRDHYKNYVRQRCARLDGGLDRSFASPQAERISLIKQRRRSSRLMLASNSPDKQTSSLKTETGLNKMRRMTMLGLKEKKCEAAEKFLIKKHVTRKRKSEEWPHTSGTPSPPPKTPKSESCPTVRSLRSGMKNRGTFGRFSLLVSGEQRKGQSLLLPHVNLCIEEENEKDCFEDMTLLQRKESFLLDKISSPQVQPVSARYQVVMELLQTEKNYVGILQTILNLFKKPLDDPNQAGGPILAGEDVKAIFSSLPDIEFVHRSMSGDLELIMNKWSDLSCVGDLVLKFASEFGRCYPPFVNFFEVSVDTINRCESRSPRFHAFLKINQAKRECGRQTLAELLINPVQRLPRVVLLLQDIKKHTERENENHPDVKSLQSAVDALKEVMTHINEDKRKTESQRQIFDIVYEVDGCPPTIVSSHRQFIARAELIAVDDNLCSKGDHVSVFVFNDCVEIAKRRRGMKGNSLKSPNVHSWSQSSVRCLKHIKLMSLSHIKKVVNINDSEECQNAVALYCRTPTDTQDWLYTFKVLYCSNDSGQAAKEEQSSNKENGLSDSEISGKKQLLKVLSKYRAITVCKAVDESFVCVVNSHELDVCTADLSSTLGRAVRAAKKSSRKLTRAFSFSRTPRRVVQRAVTMLSPQQQLPPSGQLTRSDSVTSRDLMDTDDGEAPQSTGLTPSMSVTSLCTPQRDRRGNHLTSASSLQYDDAENVPPVTRFGSKLKPSVSTLTLARPPTKADLTDFPAVPTPPTRRRRVGGAIKAATVALGRSGSFRRRVKVESAL